MEKKPLFNLERITTFVGIMGHGAVYLQAAKIFFLKSAYAVSLTGSFVACVSMIFWLSYGLSRGIKPLIISNIFGLLGMVLLLYGIIYYGTEKGG